MGTPLSEEATLLFLARLEEVQEELLYYLRRQRQQNVKVFTLKFFM